MKIVPEISDLTRHPLSTGDDIRGCHLSTEIGWNQTRDDWRYMLENGFGDGCTDRNGNLVASGMALPYGSFGWVCMVLVRESWRRRGLATTLMNGVIAELEERGITPGLDATPAGREVYLPLGFTETIGIARMVAEKATITGIDMPLSAISTDDYEEISAYDREVFGADRSALLRHLLGRQPTRAVLARCGGVLSGYALARDGVNWTQIGPVVADDTMTARALVARAASVEGRALLIDVVSRPDGLRPWLEGCGFVFQRPYHRMFRGPEPHVAHADRLFAIAGPEFG